MKQLAALLGTAAVAPAQAAIVDEDVARRVYESAGESFSSRLRAQERSIVDVPTDDAQRSADETCLHR